MPRLPSCCWDYSSVTQDWNSQTTGSWKDGTLSYPWNSWNLRRLNNGNWPGYKSFPNHLSPGPDFSIFAVVQSLSCLWLFVTLWAAAHQASLSFTISWSLLKLTFIKSGIPSNHLILCHPLLLLPSIFPSIRVFSNGSALCNWWPKYWRFSFSSSPFDEYSGLISLRIDWFDLLAFQGTFKSLLQHHRSKSINSSALSLLYGTTLTSVHDYRNNYSFDYIDLSAKWSLLFNTLSRLVIAFIPRSKHLLISGLQSPSAVILEPKKIKFVTLFIFSPIYLPWNDGPDAMIFIFWMLSFKPNFSLSSFTFIKRLFSSSSLSAIRVVLSVHLRLLTFLLAILIPVWASSSLAFRMMYSACKLNKQSDNIQSWWTPFPILNQLIVPCPVLIVASWLAYRFLRK